MHKLVKRQPAACLDDGLADVGSERVLVGVVVVCGHGVIVAGLGWECGGKNTGARIRERTQKAQKLRRSRKREYQNCFGKGLNQCLCGLRGINGW